LFSRSKRRIQALKQASSVTSSSSNSRFETPKSSSSGASVTTNDELLTHRREIALVTESIKDYYMIHGQDVDDDVIRRLKEVHREVQKKYLKYMETKLSIHPTETLILQKQP
jgi:nitrogen fixation/metabolism regulation signal transduction histidine kinase